MQSSSKFYEPVLPRHYNKLQLSSVASLCGQKEKMRTSAGSGVHHIKCNIMFIMKV